MVRQVYLFVYFQARRFFDDLAPRAPRQRGNPEARIRLLTSPAARRGGAASLTANVLKRKRTAIGIFVGNLFACLLGRGGEYLHPFYG
jgi:hypothetical protein